MFAVRTEILLHLPLCPPLQQEGLVRSMFLRSCGIGHERSSLSSENGTGTSLVRSSADLNAFDWMQLDFAKCTYGCVSEGNHHFGGPPKKDTPICPKPWVTRVGVD